MAKVTLQQLDKVGKQLAKLKDAKSKADAVANKATAEVEKLQEKYVDLLLKADKDSWTIKGVGTLSISKRIFFSIKNYKQFLTWSKTNKATKFGLSVALVKENTTVALKGVNEVLKEIVAAMKEKTPDFNFEKIAGFSFYEKISISKSSGKSKKRKV